MSVVSVENTNTRRSVDKWVNVYKKWATQQSINQNLEYFDGDYLDEVLRKFYTEVRKKDGTDYEPESLRVMQSSLQRHLAEVGSNWNILKDSKFIESRRILESKSRTLKELGMGKKKHSSDTLRVEDEDILWSTEKLGDNNSTSLVQTMWFLTTQHFGLRGCREHSSLHVEDFVFHYENNTEYIEFHEDPTIPRQSTQRPTERVTNTKMFAVGGVRCPVRLFKLYLSKRPEEMKDSGRFYLTPKRPFIKSIPVWYTKTPVGKNTISGMMKDLISGTELESEERRFTNRSIRKTTSLTSEHSREFPGQTLSNAIQSIWQRTSNSQHSNVNVWNEQPSVIFHDEKTKNNSNNNNIETNNSNNNISIRETESRKRKLSS